MDGIMRGELVMTTKKQEMRRAFKHDPWVINSNNR